LGKMVRAFLVVLLLIIPLLAKGAGGVPDGENGCLVALDRIEEGYAVLVTEDGHPFALPAYVVGPDAAEGGCFIIFALSQEETARMSLGGASSVLEELLKAQE